MSPRGEGVLVWGLATFHASTFVLVAVLLIYRGGGLGQALEGLNTLLGLALFVALWTTTYVATRNALRGLGIAMPSAIDDVAFTRRAIRWGALNGLMFLGVLVLVVPGGYALTHLGDIAQALTGPTVLQSAAFVAGGLVIASALALVIGAIVGLLFSGIDLILLGLATRIVTSQRVE
jgi:hypothetical protein